MFSSLAVAYFSLSILLSIVGVDAQQCSSSAHCPAEAPCCSEYGYCGSGPQFCLAGCNPLFSNSLDSCKPSPVCKNQKYTFADKSRILQNSTLFDGNPDSYDWVLDGGNVDVVNNELVMILTESNAGTRLSSTRFLHYGTITATLKTGRWDGVVVGFITMSNIRDEIDWEFPGNRVTQGQTNFFWQGINSHGDTTNGLTDTYQNYHDYTINWTPDALIFQIDGKTVRTLKASDYNKNGVSQYPSTPSRIQLSLWPAGTSASAPGTISWAGGMVDWNNADYKAAGNQFRTYVKSVSVTCADKPTADQVSYVYDAGSTADKQSISLSSNSPIFNGASTGTNSTGSTASGTVTSTVASGTTASTDASGTPASVTVSTSTSTTTTKGAAASTSTKSSHHHHWGGGLIGQTEGEAETSTATASVSGGGRNSTGDSGFFGGADSGTNSTSPSATDSSTSSQPTTTKNSNSAHRRNVGVLPIMSAAAILVLALIF